MERRKLGQAGLEVGVIRLGTEYRERQAQVLDSVAVAGPKTLDEWLATLRTVDVPAEEKDYRPALGSLHDRLAGQCVYCQHCLPCPDGIEVGWIIWHVDQARGGNVDQIREWYAEFRVKASECVECGICVERCPFGADIMSKFREAVALFETTVV